MVDVDDEKKWTEIQTRNKKKSSMVLGKQKKIIVKQWQLI